MTRRMALLGLAVLLAACSTPPPQRSTHFWSGRLGLHVLDEPPQNYYAAFELQGTALEGELVLLSPVGSVLARLRWNPQQATLEKGTERWQHSSVDQLTRQLTPAPVPIAALFDWLQGKAASDSNWSANLSAYDQGRIHAKRLHPLPQAELRLVLDR